MQNISVIGLGKLGICTAACFASKGFNVIGVDIDKDIVEKVSRGKATVHEPGLQELIGRSKNKLCATQDYRVAVQKSDVTFLIVPTLSNQDGSLSDRYLQDSLKQLSLAFREVDKKYHLFVITSTVSPGTIDEKLIPLIENTSKKKLNLGFGVCYNPEFIALGSVIKDFFNPDIVLIGQSNKISGDRLKSIYKNVCDNNPYFAVMSIINSEITKISLNSYITMKISFANLISNICENVPGADIDDITKALGADKRISPYYLKGGVSFGGPCFPRDNKVFAAFAKKYKVPALLSKATDDVNRLQVDHLTSRILSCIKDVKNKTVSVIGLSYKPNTPVIEESAGVKVIEKLLRKPGIKIIAYDPLGMDNARKYFKSSITYASSLKECFTRSSVCVITTQDEEFKKIDASYITRDNFIIIDCWRLLNPANFSRKVKYIAIGKN